MMKLVDSHCHLNMLDLATYAGDMKALLQAAEQQGVHHFLNVSVDLETLATVLAIAEAHPQVSASVGIHPNEILEKEITEEALLKLAQHPKVVAIGETGLDYYRTEGNTAWQQARFRTHIRVAKQLQLPLIIHTRDANEDTLRLLREENAETVGGVMHCFTGSWEVAQQAMELKFYISFSGIITFKNATELQATVKKVPLERMLIETDAPYLAPIPYRGKQNEPAYVRYVAEKVAELKEVPFQIVAEKTTENFFKLFKRAAAS